MRSIASNASKSPRRLSRLTRGRLYFLPASSRAHLISPCNLFAPSELVGGSCPPWNLKLGISNDSNSIIVPATSERQIEYSTPRTRIRVRRICRDPDSGSTSLHQTFDIEYSNIRRQSHDYPIR